jgi:hypothetical protein
MYEAGECFLSDGCQVRGDAACGHMVATSFEHSRLLAPRPACIAASEIDFDRYLHGLTNASAKLWT